MMNVVAVQHGWMHVDTLESGHVAKPMGREYQFVHDWQPYKFTAYPDTGWKFDHFEYSVKYITRSIGADGDIIEESRTDVFTDLTLNPSVGSFDESDPYSVVQPCDFKVTKKANPSWSTSVTHVSTEDKVISVKPIFIKTTNKILRSGTPGTILRGCAAQAILRDA